MWTGLLFFSLRRRLRHLLSVLAFPLQTIKDGKLRESGVMETFHVINLYLTVAIGSRTVRQKGRGVVARRQQGKQVLCVSVLWAPRRHLTSLNEGMLRKDVSDSLGDIRNETNSVCISLRGGVPPPLRKRTGQSQPGWLNGHLFLSWSARELAHWLFLRQFEKCPRTPKGNSALKQIKKEKRAVKPRFMSKALALHLQMEISQDLAEKRRHLLLRSQRRNGGGELCSQVSPELTGLDLPRSHRPAVNRRSGGVFLLRIVRNRTRLLPDYFLTPVNALHQHQHQH